MIDIIFGGETYSIDEAVYATARDQLVDYVENIINGTGAVVNIEGTEYNVDATKLQEAADKIASFLDTTMSGTGATVILNGVEHEVSADALSEAATLFIAQLEQLGGNVTPPATYTNLNIANNTNDAIEVSFTDAEGTVTTQTATGYGDWNHYQAQFGSTVVIHTSHVCTVIEPSEYGQVLDSSTGTVTYELPNGVPELTIEIIA